MAVFSNDESSRSRLDFRALKDGGVTLYCAEAVLAQDIAWLREERYVIHQFDGGRWSVEANLHEDFARALKFPGFYGRNLDALRNCMQDLDVPSDGGMAIVIRRIDSAHPGEGWFNHAVDILAGAVRHNLLFGRRLLVLLQSDDPAIEFAAMDEVPVMWNPREWLDSSRGL